MSHRCALRLTAAASRLLLAAASCVATPAQTQAEPTPVDVLAMDSIRFRIDDVEGAILGWQPWEEVWTPLQPGDIVFEGTLIQSSTPSSLRLHAIGKGKPVKDADQEGLNSGEDVQIKMPGAAMLRVHADLLRQVTLKGFTLDARKSGLPFARAAPYQHPAAKQLINAWRRVRSIGALMAALSKEMTSVLSSKKREDDVSVSAPTITVEVTQPREGAVLIVDTFPQEIPVAWTVSGGTGNKQDTYAVYLWPTSGTRGEASKVATHPPVSVPVPGPGVYNIQVSNLDETAVSSTTILNVEGVTPAAATDRKALPATH